MHELIDRRVLLITGKGGVGRSTLTAAIALAAHKRGKRVLVAEIGQADSDYTPLARLFGRDTFPKDPIPLSGGVRGVTLWPRKGHERFFKKVIPVSALVNAALSSHALQRMLDAAPSFNEMGVFYHLLTLLLELRPDGKHEHELILVDMPASGHTLGLTGVPSRVLEAMPSGPIAQAMREGQEVMHDPKQCAVWVVALPELLPVTEALELLEGLAKDKMPIGGVLLNRFVPDEFTEEERARLEPLLADREVYGKARFVGSPRSEEALERLDKGSKVRVLRITERPLQGKALAASIAEDFANGRTA